MKKLIIIATLAAFTALWAWAAQYRAIVVLDGTDASVITTNTLGVSTNLAGTNNVIAGTAVATTSLGTSNKIRKPVLINSCCVGFFTSFKLVSAGTAGPLFTLEKSYDSVNWENVMTFSNAANGTTLVSYWTNFTIYQFGYVRLAQITNNSSVAITNLLVRWYNKEDSY